MKSLKILHIGNIANNAYVNAKLLRERGHECHVACNDFYHFAGCSEWYDLSIEANKVEIGDQNFPNFWRLGARKPHIPRWFAQGPNSQVLIYLYWLNKGQNDLSDLAWSVLQYQKFKVISKRDTMAFADIWGAAELEEAIKELGVAPDFSGELRRGSISDTPRHLVADWNRRVGSDPSSVNLLTYPAERSWLEGYAVYDPPIRALLDIVPAGAYLNAIGFEARPTESSGKSLERLALHAGSEAYSDSLGQWREICKFYDLVIAYGPSPIIPYLAGVDNFIAYEHGTLRDLPFDGSLQAQLISAAYTSAATVFVTNNDYLTQERQLAITPERLQCLPHAFDERPLREYIAENPPSRTDRVTFFAPARQDWIKQFRTMTKNNHFIVHAAKTLLNEGRDEFRVIFIEWGEDVDQTKDLIAELGVANCFEWWSPLAKHQLWSAYASAHAVIDQFLLPSISGVSFEALALGCRVITCDDGTSNRLAFGEQPPLLAAHDVDSVVRAMKAVLDDPFDKAQIGASAWTWVDRCHSAKRIVDLQESVFANILDA